MQDARSAANEATLASKINEYETVVEQYITALMAMTQIYWENGQYSVVLSVLSQAKDFAADHKAWKLNVAHAHFMMVCCMTDLWRRTQTMSHAR
jgi:hypothetical protein